MKEIYLIDKGDSIRKIEKLCIRENLFIENEKIFNKKYIALNNDNDDIIIVKNYRPIIEYIVKKDESILDIMSRGYDIEGDLASGVGDTIILSKPSSIRYIVKPTDTLLSICRRFGVEYSDIYEANALKTDKLFIGQVLWI